MYTADNLQQFTGIISEAYTEGVFRRLQYMSDEELDKITVLLLSKEEHDFIRAYGYCWVTVGERKFYSFGIGVFRIEIKTEA